MNWAAWVFAGAVLVYAVWAVVHALRGGSVSGNDWTLDGPEGNAAAPVRVGPTVLPTSSYRTPGEELSGLSAEAIELLLDEHYRRVLCDPAARKVWRKLLSDAAAVERMAKVGR